MTFQANKIFPFIKVMQALKTLERFKGQVFWRDYPFPKRYESVADHTWRMAMILVILESELAQEIDLLKALKITLIHDVPEILAGDASPIGEDGTGAQTHAYNKDIKHERHQLERQAAESLFSSLPQRIGQELLDLWLEYEDQQTFESQVVKAIDKFEGKLQVLEYTQGTMFTQHWEFTQTYGAESTKVDPALEALMEQLIDELRDKFHPFEAH